MSLVKPSYNDACGNSYTASFWYAVQTIISTINGSITVTFYGWKDAASCAGGKQPLPGAVKVYNVTGADFQSVGGAAPNGTTNYGVIANAVETYALNKKDTDSGTKDTSGNPVMVSFFDGATQTGATGS